MNAHNEQHDPASPVVKQNLTTQPAAAQLGDRLDRAYAERNALAIAFAKAALAAGWRAGRGYDDDQSKDWAPQWRHVVYVDLPDGRQVSWHMAPAEVELLDRLPQYAGEWNGEFTARDPSWCRFDAPPAAQEAVAWQVDDEFYPSESLAIEAIQQWGPSGAIAIPLYAAAPVTAAPADDEEDAYVIDQMGKLLAEIAVIVNGPEPAGTRWSYHDLPAKVKALASTPAAPGIGLQAFRKVAMPLLCQMLCSHDAESVARKLHAALLDASPKGATFPNDGNSEAQFIADGERLNCPACGGSGHVEDSPKGGSEAWREGWALAYSGPSRIYGDDGELQDNSEYPYIDWRRDSAEVIRDKITERANRKLATAQASDAEVRP